MDRGRDLRRVVVRAAMMTIDYYGFRIVLLLLPTTVATTLTLSKSIEFSLQQTTHYDLRILIAAICIVQIPTNYQSHRAGNLTGMKVIDINSCRHNQAPKRI